MNYTVQLYCEIEPKKLWVAYEIRTRTDSFIGVKPI